MHHALAQALSLLVTMPLPPAAVSRLRALPGRAAQPAADATDTVSAHAVAAVLSDLAGVIDDQRRRLTEVSRLAEQLQHALNSRVIIEQAKGLTAGRTGLTIDEAFAMLRRHARNNNLKLDEVCRQVVAGEIPVDTIGAPPPRA